MSKRDYSNPYDPKHQPRRLKSSYSQEIWSLMTGGPKPKKKKPRVRLRKPEAPDA